MTKHTPVLVMASWALLASVSGCGGSTATTAGDTPASVSASPTATSPSASPTTSSPSASRTSQPSTDLGNPYESAGGGPAAEQILTAKNSQEMAAMLNVSDPCDEKVAAFVAKYPGRTIEFDGSIAAMGNHGDYKTRYDILINPGNKGANSTRGPAFRFTDVNVLDLHLSGTNGSDTIGVGDLLHVVAQVGKQNPLNTCLVMLDPVSTSFR